MDINVIKYFKENNDKISYDTLTSVLSRKTMVDYIDYLIENNTKFTVFFIDIDDFKSINDTLGHSAGDKALITCSERMKMIFDDNNGVVGRYGGDEFFAVVENEIEYEKIWTIASQLNKIIRKPNNLSDIDKALPAGKFTITSGIARFPIDAKTKDKLFEICDKALYIGKQKGKNCFIIYNQSLHSNIFKDREIKKIDVKGVIDYIFTTLTDKSKSLNENLVEAITFVSKYFDVSLASKNYNNKFEILYSNGTLNKAKYVDEKEYLDLKTSEVDSMIFMYINKLSPRCDNLKKIFEEQSIHASILIPCQTKTKNYGYLRIDAKHERIWTKEEKMVFQIIANLYAMLLELTNENF